MKRLDTVPASFAHSADFLRPFADEIEEQLAGVTINRLRAEGQDEAAIAAHRALWTRRKDMMERWVRLDCPESGFDMFLAEEIEARKYGGAAPAETPRAEVSPGSASAAGTVEPYDTGSETDAVIIPDTPFILERDPIEAAPASPQTEQTGAARPAPEDKEPLEPAAPVVEPGLVPPPRALAFGLRETLWCAAAGFALAAALPREVPLIVVDPGRVALEGALSGQQAVERETRAVLARWIEREGAVVLPARSALAYPAGAERTSELVRDVLGRLKEAK
jgi:hypothetical protein